MGNSINSITKNKQTNNSLSLITKTVFDCKISEENITELGDGYCNAIYKINFTTPIQIQNLKTASAIIKIAPSPSVEMMTYEKDLLKTEVETLQLLSTVHISEPDYFNFKIPQVLYYDTSCTICNAPYFFMTQIPGNTLSTLPRQSIDLQNKFASTLGSYLKTINSFSCDHFGIMNCPSTFCKTNQDFIKKIFRMVLDDGIKKNCDLKAISYEEMWNLLTENSTLFSDVKKPSLVHWDLWEGNVFIKDNEVSGIIDFERALWGDPLMEQEFSNFIPPRPAFLKTYGKATFTEKEKVKCQFYKIYRELVMIVECSYRHYETEAQYNWVTSELKKDISKLQEMIYNYRTIVINEQKKISQ